MIVVSFLHSYANPKNERLAGDVLRKFWPNEYIVLGSDVCPAVREFERTSTAVISGYIQPVISRYLGDLTEKLAAKKYQRDVLIIQSNGGVMSALCGEPTCREYNPVGARGGVTASTAIAAEMAVSNVVSCDMGGTSFDVCVIKAGRPDDAAKGHRFWVAPLLTYARRRCVSRRWRELCTLRRCGF